jgi:hypothetical protein
MGTRPGETKAHEIVRVVGCVEGLSFEAAKIRTAELIGREDLIQARSKNKYYQKHDANSLLNPPTDNRDDELPFRCLGSRLGSTPAEMPRPATPFVAIKGLEYFDPPVSPTAKPKLIGSWPCAVFATVAVDGRKHAHKIYLSPDGRSKADLGSDPNGRPREPKKSAKVPEGASRIAGCAVIWGDPEKAPHLVLFERIQNAAAGAVAFLAQIRARDKCAWLLPSGPKHPKT